jgi:hypothetical protein
MEELYPSLRVIAFNLVFVIRPEFKVNHTGVVPQLHLIPVPERMKRSLWLPFPIDDISIPASREMGWNFVFKFHQSIA